MPSIDALVGVDLFSVATCRVPDAGMDVKVQGMTCYLSRSDAYVFDIAATECVSDHGKQLCHEINGICTTEQDGYYIVSAICMAFGVVILLAFILPTARKLQGQFSVLFKWDID